MQIEIAEAILAHEKVLVPSCVSSGKSFGAAAIIPWWLTGYKPARVFTIAPTERQLNINIWGELAKIKNASRIPIGGELLTLDYKWGPNWYAKGFSPKDGFGVFGIHGEHDLVIFDDSQGISLETFEAFENASAAGTARFLYLCNPAVVSGYIYDALTGRKKMHIIRIDAWDTPNVSTRSIVVPGLLTYEKVEEWIAEYGWNSDFVRVKVRALPPKQEPDTLIPIDWVALARAREYEIKGATDVVIGVDVARFGDDKSVIIVRQERLIVQIFSMHGNDLMQLTGKIAEVADQFEWTKPKIYVDVIGVGSGVVDRLGELKYDVIGINVGLPATDEEKFGILRDESWWAARESLNPENPAAICISEDIDEEERNYLEADLTAMKWTIQSDKKIVVEKKKITKERIGRSTDYGDAYCLCVYNDYSKNIRPAVTFDNRIGLPRRPSWLR